MLVVFQVEYVYCWDILVVGMGLQDVVLFVVGEQEVGGSMGQIGGDELFFFGLYVIGFVDQELVVGIGQVVMNVGKCFDEDCIGQ